jgi:hypothetical protein
MPAKTAIPDSNETFDFAAITLEILPIRRETFKSPVSGFPSLTIPCLGGSFAPQTCNF